MTDNSQTFWSRMDGTNAGMLGLKSDGRLVPMSHYVDTDANSLWFITAQGTDLVRSLDGGSQDANYVIASGSEGLYTSVVGTLALNNDAAKLDEIWNAVAAAWFEGGKRDSDIRLLQLKLSNAEVWATTSSGLAFLYEIAKAKVTGAEPDMGEHFSLTF